MTQYQEPYLSERLDQALASARKLIANKIETVRDLHWALRVVISDHYGIPLFDRYFEGRTLDQLAFEAFFIRERQVKGADTVSQAINENLDEAAAVVEEQFAEFEQAFGQPSAEEQSRFQEFFQTGKFTNEK